MTDFKVGDKVRNVNEWSYCYQQEGVVTRIYDTDTCSIQCNFPKSKKFDCYRDSLRLILVHNRNGANS